MKYVPKILLLLSLITHSNIGFCCSSDSKTKIFQANDGNVIHFRFAAHGNSIKVRAFNKIKQPVATDYRTLLSEHSNYISELRESYAFGVREFAVSKWLAIEDVGEYELHTIKFLKTLSEEIQNANGLSDSEIRDFNIIEYKGVIAAMMDLSSDPSFTFARAKGVDTTVGDGLPFDEKMKIRNESIAQNLSDLLKTGSGFALFGTWHEPGVIANLQLLCDK